MGTVTVKQRLSLFFISILIISLLTACGRSEGDAGGQQGSEEQAASANEELQENENAASYGVLAVGDKAPDFTAALTDGTAFTLSEQEGKVVLLNFWATWCGPCVREMPAFEKLHGEYGEDAVILAVNCMDDAAVVDAFLEENGYTFPIAYDEKGEIVMKYPSQGIPYTLVIGADGVIRQIYVGAADAETQYLEYKSAVDEVMAEAQ